MDQQQPYVSMVVCWDNYPPMIYFAGITLSLFLTCLLLLKKPKKQNYNSIDIKEL